MKKILCFLLASLLAFSFVACGTYNGPMVQAGTEQEGGETADPTESDSSDEDTAFTVSLMLDGEPFSPAEPINAQWTDGFSFHAATIDENGEASVEGLDGDYQVTLSSVPDGLTYNPNVYTATNDDRHTVIELYELDKIGRGGNDLYNCIELVEPGVYQVEITGPEHVVLFEFTPRVNGMYSVESWVDVTANDINPKVDVYHGSSQFKVFAYTLDDGGTASHYTKNFKHEVNVADEGIGQAFTFGVRCDSKDGTYPVKVNFVVQLNGGFEMNRNTATIMVPEHESIYTNEQYAYLEAHPVAGELVGLETPENGANIFDGDLYGYNEETGFYHKLNEATGKFDGPVIYAYISTACRFYDKAFTVIEDEGNKALTVSNNTENYKLFVEGYASLVGKNYFCVPECPCRSGEDGPNVGQENLNGGACKVSDHCQKCHKDCRPCPDEAYGQIGYADVAVDGLCPVTQELKDFLQKFSSSQMLFFDGNGFVETHPTIKVQSAEDEQWMFACGYYTEQK